MKTLATISIASLKEEDINSPVEEVHPQDPPTVPVNPDTTQIQTVRNRRLFAITRRRRCHKQDKADDVQSNSRDHLEQLVLDIFVLGEEALGSSDLFLAKKNRVRDGSEDERVEKSKGEFGVFCRYDGCQEGGEDREYDYTGLGDVQGLEARRCIVGEAEEFHGCWS